MRLGRLVHTIGRSGRLGVGVGAAVAVAGLALATGFLDPLSLLITVGGALGVTRMTFSRARLVNAWRHVLAALEEDRAADELITALKRLARVHRTGGTPALDRAAAAESDPALRRAIALALECQDTDELGEVLLAEARRAAAEGEASRHVLLTLGKLFPAFGLIGTLIGLVLLLRHLASPSLSTVGPGLGIAVLTTLYGAVFGNVVILPLATKLHGHLARQALRTQMLIEGVLLVHRQEYPTRIERLLRSYLGAEEPAERGPVATVARRAA